MMPIFLPIKARREIKKRATIQFSIYDYILINLILSKNVSILMYFERIFISFLASDIIIQGCNKSARVLRT